MMPYFRWSGVTLTGQVKRGVLFAQSNDHVDQQLLRRQVALLSCNPTRFFKPLQRVSLASKIDVFHQLQALIDAGILLPKALDIIAHQAGVPALQHALAVISAQVHEGVLFGVAMQNFPAYFDPLCIQMMLVGQESGNMSAVLHVVCTYLETNQDFNARLRAALYMPLITLLFFLGVSAMIFLVILPRFAIMFASLGQQLPPFTQRMIAVSNFCTSWSMMWVLLCAALVCCSALVYKKTVQGRKAWDRFVVRLPFVGGIIQDRFIAYYTHSVALLMRGGMQLVPAMEHVQKSVTNHVLRAHVTAMAYAVQQGATIADAMSDEPQLFTPDIVAAMHVGQEAGTVDTMLCQVAALYRDKVKKRLTFFTTVINPCVLIILALLIAALIVTVYMPILNMSYAV
jgi:type II secretory pathway component PulF